LNRKVPNLRYT